MRSAKFMDMCSGPILRKMIVFTLPIMFSGLFQLLFNATDIIVVGKFAGDNALAAVGSNTALINLMTNLFIGLSIGANVAAARYCGAKNITELKKTVHTAMLLSVISGLLLMVVGLCFAEQMLRLMQTPESIIGMASDYLRIYFCGMPFMMIYNFGNALLRAAGDTRRPLIYLIIAGVANVGLDLIFVILLNMSAAGVGLATSLSQCVSAALIIRCLMKEKEDTGLRLNLRKLRIHKDKLFLIMKIGLPAGFQGTVFSLSNVVIQSSINLFGEAVIAGNSAAASIEGFVYMAMNSCYQSTLSFTSQNLGAGKYERINKILLSGLLCVVTVWAVLGLGICMTVGRPLLSIYTSGEASINAGLRRMMYVCGTYFLCGIMDVMVGSLRGMGYSITPMIVSLLGACGLRLVWLGTVFQIEQFHTPDTVYLSYPVSWVITVAAHVICFFICRHRLQKKMKKLQITS
ncbi:MAG: MATE family efflux transporter [Oscillospiraceae bacterium]|nr:MATE family efflux transporter [Oscillospiraceae bacterium]